MAIEVETALLCDQVRQEVNGKLIAIGIYSSSVVLGTFPAVAHFTVLARIRTDTPGTHTLNLRVKLGDEVQHEVEGQLEVRAAQADWLPIPLQPVQFMVPTSLSIEQQVQGGDWVKFLRTDVQRAPKAGAQAS